MPGDIVGTPDSVIRDALGKTIYVDYVEGEEPLTSEEYVCLMCVIFISKSRQQAEHPRRALLR